MPSELREPASEPAQGPSAESTLTVAEARRIAFRRLIAVTLLAAVVAMLLFAAIWYLPFGNSAFSGFANWFYSHSALLILAALSPLMASLLVGYGYMTRAMRRRAAEKAGRTVPVE
jgi:hypothetical protein